MDFLTIIVRGICIAYFVFLFAVGITSVIDFIRRCPGLSHMIRSTIIMAILFSAVGISIVPYIMIGHISMARFCTEIQTQKKGVKPSEDNSK